MSKVNVLNPLCGNRPLLCWIASLLMLVACKPHSLPTIGRTHGDLPMTLLLQPETQCTRVVENIYFDASFATGMSFRSGDCLSADQKIGRKTVAELTKMHASITFDGEYYIVKNGY